MKVYSEESEIDLTLLHKKNRSESFLVSCVKTSGHEFHASAFLPQHHYYNDQIGHVTNLMYLLECARQVETFIVHRFFSQPLDMHFILTEFTCSMAESFKPDNELIEETIELYTTVYNSKFVNQRLFSQDYKIEI